jgi:hypothetical protein
MGHDHLAGPGTGCRQACANDPARGAREVSPAHSRAMTDPVVQATAPRDEAGDEPGDRGAVLNQPPRQAADPRPPALHLGGSQHAI